MCEAIQRLGAPVFERLDCFVARAPRNDGLATVSLSPNLRMTDMRRGRLMQDANEDHTAWKLRVRVAHCPPPPVARKLSYPSWKVIVSAYMANTLSRALTSPAFFRGECQLENKTAVIAKSAVTKSFRMFA
jgi:hypothetical protein